MPDSYIYLVDDGSQDKTWSIIDDLHRKNPLVKGAKFVKITEPKGFACRAFRGARNRLRLRCVDDADLQQDQWAIERFVDKYAEGYDIVSGIRNGRETDSFFKNTPLCFSIS